MLESVYMKRLNPEKLHVTYLDNILPDEYIVPRYYTLTHSDRTGELFLSIGKDYNNKQISKLYTRLMRDEVLGELVKEQDLFLLKIYCHVSGGLVIGAAKWRYNIFHSELPLVIEAIRYGDEVLFKQNPKLDEATILIYFQSTNRQFNTIENWGTLVSYK